MLLPSSVGKPRLPSTCRLVLAVVHINHNLERIGDQFVNIAKLFQLTIDTPIPANLIHDFTAMSSARTRCLRWR